jgi:hypothetical protein
MTSSFSICITYAGTTARETKALLRAANFPFRREEFSV